MSMLSKKEEVVLQYAIQNEKNQGVGVAMNVPGISDSEAFDLVEMLAAKGYGIKASTISKAQLILTQLGRDYFKD